MSKYNENQGKKVLAITLMVAFAGGVWYVNDQQKLAASEEEIVSEYDEGRTALGGQDIITLEEDEGRDSYQGQNAEEIPVQEEVIEAENTGDKESLGATADNSETKDASESSDEEEVDVVNESENYSIKVNDVSKVYGENDPQFTCSITGIDADKLGEIHYSCVHSNDVGKYTITATCDNGNTIASGTLTITPAKNTVKVQTENLTYNGNEQSALTVDTTEGTKIAYTVDGKETTEAPTFKDAGTYSVTVKATKDNYEDVTENVQVVVAKKDVTLTSGSQSKEYDGTALTCKEVGPEGFVNLEDEKLTYEYTGSQLDAGSSNNIFTYTGDESVLKNYNITVNYGTLTVTPITQVITIKAGSTGKEYDGTPLSYNGYSYTGGILVNGDVLTATVEGSITNVSDGKALIGPSGKACGEIENKVSSYTITRDGKDISGNYTVICESGKLDIYKKEVSIIVDNTYKVVGQKDPDFTYSVNGIIGNDSIGTVTFERDPGERESYKDQQNDGYEIYADCTDENPNYTVSESVAGKLYIVPFENQAFVTVTTTTSTYNGTSNYLSVKAPAGCSITYSVDNGKNWTANSPKLSVGNYTIMVKATNETGSYTCEKDVIIAPRKISITAGSGYKLYDGSALKQTSAYLTSGSLAAGDTISYIGVNGKQTSVGTSANKITSVVIVDADGNDVTSNYNITKVDGTLTVAWKGTTPDNQQNNGTSNSIQNNATEEKTDKDESADIKEISIGSTNTGKDLTEKTDNETPEAKIDLEEKNYILPIIALIIAVAVGLWFFIIGKRRKKEEEA